MKIGQKLDHLLLARMAMHRARDIHLDPIAGGKENRLGLGEFVAQLAECSGGLLLVKDQGLTHLKRRRGVVEPDEEEAVDQPLPPGMNWTATSVPKTRTKPKTLSIAARRPRKRGLIGACMTIA